MNRLSNKKRKIKLIIFSVLILLITIPFSTYLISYQAQSDALQSYSFANKKNGYYGFESDGSTQGIIYYPGGLVDPRSYAGFAKLLSEQSDSYVFVTQPLFNLAITDINKAKRIIQDYPLVTSWWIGGHSLGGSSAAFYGINEVESLQGIFFLASYSTAQADFSSTSLPMLSIIGDQDQILDNVTYQQSLIYFSSQLTTYTVQGGNHSQFGDYGLQRGDGAASLSRFAQHELVVEQLILWMVTNASN